MPRLCGHYLKIYRFLLLMKYLRTNPATPNAPVAISVRLPGSGTAPAFKVTPSSKAKGGIPGRPLSARNESNSLELFAVKTKSSCIQSTKPWLATSTTFVVIVWVPRLTAQLSKVSPVNPIAVLPPTRTQPYSFAPGLVR